ncbi:UNVERIFIED_CONTAM: hypothetical protein BEN50_03250 [Euhalothece sp. KZN 001]
MPNLLEAVIPRILSQGLVALRENAIMPRVIRTDFSSEAAQRGQSIDVPIPSDMGDAEDVVPSKIDQDPVDLTPTYRSITLDRWKKKGWTLSDKEMREIQAGYPNVQITEAAKSLANTLDKDILSLYKTIPHQVGVPGETPFQDASGTEVYKQLLAAKEARRILNKNACPEDNRRLVLGVDAEANATVLPALLSADRAGTDDIIREAAIGRKMQFDWLLDQNVLSHTQGLATGTSITTSAAASEGDVILPITGASSAPNVGDLITIDGLDGFSFVVQSGSTQSSLNIYPALPADVTSGTTVNTDDTDSVENLAVHRDAFALAIRPLDDVDSLGNSITTFVDDVTQIPLRLEIKRQNKQTLFEFDILYGFQSIRRECAVRVRG